MNEPPAGMLEWFLKLDQAIDNSAHVGHEFTLLRHRRRVLAKAPLWIVALVAVNEERRAQAIR